MAAVTLEVTLAVLDRDGSTRGFVACQSIAASTGKGLDTPDLAVTVDTLEDDLAADADLFDDALVQLLYDTGSGAAAVGPLFRVETDDLTLIGGDDEADGQLLQVTAKSALNIADEWQVTPAEGVWLRRSPSVIYFDWTHPDFDDSGWFDPTRRERDVDPDCGPGTPKFTEPAHWENPDSDWINDEEQTGGLTLVRPPAAYSGVDDRQVRLASTADEEHRQHLYGPGYGGIVRETSKQETGYTHRLDFDRVLTGGEDYYPTFEMTTVHSDGGDGFDALSYYMGSVGTNDFLDEYDVHSGNTGIKVWRQDKDDPQPGLTAGKIMLLLLAWNQAWMTDTSASCHTTTFSFTETLDSNGDDLVALAGLSFNTQQPVTEVMAVLSAWVDFDCHLDETDGHLVIDMFNRKGSDLSGSVAIVSGNPDLDGFVLSHRALRRRRTATRASVITGDGFTTKVDATLETTVPPRAAALSSQQAASTGAGRALAAQIIAEDAQRQMFETVLSPDDSALPGVSFDWGDDVSGLDRAGASGAKTVTKWSLQRDGDDAPTFTVTTV